MDRRRGGMGRDHRWGSLAAGKFDSLARRSDVVAIQDKQDQGARELEGLKTQLAAQLAARTSIEGARRQALVGFWSATYVLEADCTSGLVATALAYGEPEEFSAFRRRLLDDLATMMRAFGDVVLYWDGPDTADVTQGAALALKAAAAALVEAFQVSVDLGRLYDALRRQSDRVRRATELADSVDESLHERAERLLAAAKQDEEAAADAAASAGKRASAEVMPRLYSDMEDGRRIFRDAVRRVLGLTLPEVPRPEVRPGPAPPPHSET